jgi:DNA adenine methylase Dam
LKKSAISNQQVAAAHARDGHRHYYRVRDRQFNPLREGLRSATGRIAYTPDLAAMLIYLNRTGFNGLFRVNARGEFNVPAGRYDRPTIVDRPKLMRVAHALAGKRVRLECGSFEIALTIAEAGDFLYVDPPHAPLSVTSSFTSYTAPRFAAADQRRLHAMIVELARRGCHVLLKQLNGRRNCCSLRCRRRGPRRRPAGAARAGAACCQQQQHPAWTRRGVPDHEYLGDVNENAFAERVG